MISLHDALYAQLADREHPSGIADRHAHASEAGQCARAIWYRCGGMTQSNPAPLSTLVAFQIGTALHLAVQAAIGRTAASWETEVYWEHGPVSGHADVLYTSAHGHKVVAEIKTANPFAWKYMTEPKREHLLQASLNALGLGADFIHIVYLNIAAKRGDDPLREFMLTVNRAEAEIEMARLTTIAITPRIVPREYGHAEILDPASTDFPCTYCPFRDQCVRDGQ